MSRGVEAIIKEPIIHITNNRAVINSSLAVDRTSNYIINKLVDNIIVTLVAIRISSSTPMGKLAMATILIGAVQFRVTIVLDITITVVIPQTCLPDSISMHGVAQQEC